MVGLVDSTTSGSGAVGEALEEACGLFLFSGRRAVYRRIYFFFSGLLFFFVGRVRLWVEMSFQPGS